MRGNFGEAKQMRIKNPITKEEKIEWAKQHEYDCIVQCPKCQRTQYLQFKNGLKNGWSSCCGGLTMPILWQEVDIEKAVSAIIKETLEKV
jgi:hypothetical protein